MTDTDLQGLFACTTRAGLRPPADAQLQLRVEDEYVSVFAAWQTPRGAYEWHEERVSRIVPIRSASATAYPRRPQVDVDRGVRLATISLAYACVDDVRRLA